MAENLFSSILDIHKEIYNPDYYQLLLLDPEETNSEVVEEQFKVQMSKVQSVKSTKYKDFVEFLKGELKQARRILNDQNLRGKYDKEREKEASEKLRDIVEMFIQISGDLSEIEIRETFRRGKYLNLNKKTIDRIIDEELKSLGCKRIKANQEQLNRASEIMQKRVGRGYLADAPDIIDISPHTESKADDANPLQDRRNLDRRKDGRRKEDIKKQQDLQIDAEKLQKQAERKKKFKPIFSVLKTVNLFFNLLGWLLAAGLIFIIFFINDTPEIQDAVKTIFNLKSLTDGQENILPKNTKTQINDKINNNVVENDNSAKQTKILEHESDTMLSSLHKLIYSSKGSFLDNIDKVRIKILDYYQNISLKLKNLSSESKEKTELLEEKVKVLDYYQNILSPLYYSTRKKWAWDMFTKPIDFIYNNIEFTDSDAILKSENEGIFISFGGAFLTGRIIIDGAICSDNQGCFGFEFYRDIKDISAQIIIDPKQKLMKFVANYEELKHDKKNINKITQIEVAEEIKEFQLEIIVKTSQQTRNKIEFQNTFSTIYNSVSQIKTVLCEELPFICENGNRLALFITENSKLRLNKILVEPYN